MNDLTASSTVYTDTYVAGSPNPLAFSGLSIGLVSGHIYQFSGHIRYVSGANDEVYQYNSLNSRRLPTRRRMPTYRSLKGFSTITRDSGALTRGVLSRTSRPPAPSPEPASILLLGVGVGVMVVHVPETSGTSCRCNPPLAAWRLVCDRLGRVMSLPRL